MPKKKPTRNSSKSRKNQIFIDRKTNFDGFFSEKKLKLKRQQLQRQRLIDQQRANSATANNNGNGNGSSAIAARTTAIPASTLNPVYEYSEELHSCTERDLKLRREHLATVCERYNLQEKYPPNPWEFFISPGHNNLVWCNRLWMEVTCRGI